MAALKSVSEGLTAMLGRGPAPNPATNSSTSTFSQCFQRVKEEIISLVPIVAVVSFLYWLCPSVMWPILTWPLFLSLYLFLAMATFLSLVFFGRFFYCQYRRKVRKDVGGIGFFHPFCDGNGGGECVLWCAIKKCIGLDSVLIYTAHETAARAKDVFRSVETNFGVAFSESERKRVEFVGVSGFMYLDPSLYLGNLFQLSGFSNFPWSWMSVPGNLIKGMSFNISFCIDDFNSIQND